MEVEITYSLDIFLIELLHPSPEKSPIQNTATCLRWQPGQTHKFAVGSESGQVSMLDTRAGVDNFLTASPHERSVYSLQFCADRFVFMLNKLMRIFFFYLNLKSSG